MQIVIKAPCKPHETWTRFMPPKWRLHYTRINRKTVLVEVERYREESYTTGERA